MAAGWDAEIGDAEPSARKQKAKARPVLTKVVEVKVASTNAVVGLRGSVGDGDGVVALVSGDASATAPRLKSIKVSSN